MHNTFREVAMKQSAKIINRTIECDSSSISASNIKENAFRISGKAAAVYYSPPGFDKDSIRDLTQRAMDEAKEGNYAVFDHGTITFLLKTPKIMSMVLKSMNLYNATEKSARYSTLDIETEVEREMYDKWKGRFASLIKSYYGAYYTDAEITQLAMENARYMTSIFTPTVLEYTVPFGRAVMLSKWLKDLGELMGSVNTHVTETEDAYHLKYNWIYGEFASKCLELSEVIGDAIGVYNFGDIIVDQMNMGVEFFRVANYILKTRDIVAKNEELRKDDIADLYRDSIKEDFYSDSYISNYKASFVAISQMETHRSLHYNIDIPVFVVEPYIPKIIRGSVFEVEWRNDFQKLADMKILPQATLLEVSESGRFEDFYQKCKARLCARSQLETTEITRDQVVKFANYSSNLSGMNMVLLSNMIRKGPNVNWKKPETVIVEARCRFADYKCTNPCKIFNENINYFRNI